MWLVVVHAFMFQLAMIGRAQRRATEEVESLSTVLERLEENSREGLALANDGGASDPGVLESGMSMAILIAPPAATSSDGGAMYPAAASAASVATTASQSRKRSNGSVSGTARRPSTATSSKDASDRPGAEGTTPGDAKPLKLAERRWISEHQGERCFNLRYVVRFKLRAERWADMFFVVLTTIVYGVLSWQLLVTDTYDE